MSGSNGVFGLPVHNVVKPIDIDMSMHKENRQRLTKAFQAKDVPSNSIIYMQGGPESARYNTDREEFFRQESYFFWAFGANIPDVAGFIDIDTGKSTLVVPYLPEVYEIWMGKRWSLPEYKNYYGVDEAIYESQLEETLAEKNPEVIYTLQGYNTDSGELLTSPPFAGYTKFRIDNGKLYPIISQLRSIKTKKEIDFIRNLNEISSEAHLAVMAAAKPGMRECEMEALFQHWTYAYGLSRYWAYIPICASGPNAAVLHYGHAGAPNSRVMQDGDLTVNDMGGERHCFASDITCSFPINGKFTENQKFIYETVLKANNAVEKEMKPGVYWPDMHALAYRIILDEFKKKGILTGDVEKMMDDNVASIFMPHGLGHLMGLDVHDVGGRPKGSKSDSRLGFKSVRLVNYLEEGMVLTCEPGCYFIDSLLDSSKELLEKYANKDMLDQFRGFGGVRIEDNVVVTKDGIEVFTKVPRTVEEVEKACAGQIATIADIGK